LKIETTPREDHQTTMTVEVDPEQLESARRRAARKIAEHAKIPGFRPGKAPYDVVRRMYGDSAITEEAVELLVNDVYPLAIKEANIEPAAMGQLENVESLDPPKFIFTVPLAPKVELGDYKSVRLPYEWKSPTDEQLEEAIQNLRRMYSATESVERPAAEGDYVLVDVNGVKAKPKEGDENTPLVERDGFATMIRKDEKEDEWPFPGFAAKLTGLKPGDESSFTHKFAKDHTDEALQGQNVKFTVKVKTVRGVNMPALDDMFAAKTGLGLNVDELRVRMRENLEAESRGEYDDKYYEDAIDQIKAGATIKYPPQVLEHEKEHVIADIENRLKSQGIENLEAYYKLVDTTPEKFLEEQVKPVAQRRLERGLILDEIVRTEKLAFDEQALDAEFNRAWSALVMNDPEFSKRTKGGMKPTRDIVDAVAMDSANRLLARMALDKIKAIANNEIAEEAPVAQEKPVKAKKAKAVKAVESEVPVAAEGEAKPAKKKAPAKKKSE
jgi:trigger factor